MNWFERIDMVFSFHPTGAVIIGALFIVPALQLAMAPLVFKNRFAIRVSAVVGRWEHAVGWMRDWICMPYLVGALVWNTYRYAAIAGTNPWNRFAASAIVSLALIAAGIVCRVLKKSALLHLMDFMIRFPDIHPQEFFQYYYAAHGVLRHRLPPTPHRLIDPMHVDMRPRGKKSRHALWPVIVASLTIKIITELILAADRWRGKDFARRVGSSIAVIGATRTVQLAGARIAIENVDNLKGIAMPFIYCCNHTSALDFLTISLLLLAHKRLNGIDVATIPCFLLARDHFLENPLLYRVLGLGRAAEILGMVFVERKQRSRAKAEDVVRQAVAHALAGDMPLVIFPQGSRSRSRVSAEGARLDAGYYTVGAFRRLRRDGGHIKKGAAFIATDAARELASEGKSGKVALVPVAYLGAATVMPRKSICVQTGVGITVRVGEPVVVTSDMGRETLGGQDMEAYHHLVDEIHRRVDQALKTALRTHADLECRFFEDVRGMLDPLKVEELAIAMKPWRREDYIVYATLDFIYACRPREWRSLLGQLAHLILTDASRDNIAAFKERVAGMLPH